MFDTELEFWSTEMAKIICNLFRSYYNVPWKHVKQNMLVGCLYICIHYETLLFKYVENFTCKNWKKFR